MPKSKSWIFEIFNYPFNADPAKFDPQLCKELYNWKLESWIAAEHLGFDGVFFSEHHFTSYNVSPSPNLLVAALAQRTQSLRVGVMANITAFHNPRRLAEEAAMLDYLSGGRLEVGLGRGVDEQEFLKEGIPMEETRPRFEESLELITKAWYEPTFSHHGKFFDYDNVSIWPRPLRTELPLWITALSPSTVTWAAEKGYRFTSVFQSTAELKKVFDIYKDAAVAAGRQPQAADMGVCRNVVIADSDQEARDIAEPAFGLLFGLFKEAAVFHDLDHVPTGYEFYSSFFRPFVGGDVSFDALIDMGVICVGSPSTVRDQIVAQIEEIGCGHFLNWGSFGNMTREQTLRSYELYATNVIPALEDARV